MLNPRIMKCASVFLLFVFLVSFNVIAETAGGSDMENGSYMENQIELGENLLNEVEKMFYSCRRGHYNSEKEPAEVIEALEYIKEKLDLLNNNDESLYYSGQIDFLLGEIYEVIGNQRKAAVHFNSSAKNAEKLIDIDSGNNTEGYRLLADSYMRLMSYNGDMYMVSKAPEVIKLLNRALSIDNENYAALNSLAMYYVNAPQFGGGNVDRGIKDLERALESEDLFDNFISYIWLATAYHKKGNIAEAEDNIEKALQIYPDSSWAAYLLDQIKGGDSNQLRY
ncbi:MAG: tetratricopeptide repeat protein [Halanaerobiales bacterium]